MCIVAMESMVAMVTMTMMAQWSAGNTILVGSSCSGLDIFSNVVHLQLPMAITVVVWAETDINTF